ncbi:MAG: T9SS type A sorting domain-containing protein, partial [Spirosomataceae bacterium]
FDSGLIQCDLQNKITKFDTNGKVEWTFQPERKTTILTSTPPFLGLTTNNSNQSIILILDKNGKKMGETAELSFRSVFQSNDNGFWLVDRDFNYLKFDSTGHQTAKFSELANNYSYIKQESVLQDNSLILYQVNTNNIVFIKISPSGDVQRVSVPTLFNVPANTSPFDIVTFKVINQSQSLMYAIKNQENIPPYGHTNFKIGSINLASFEIKWQNTIDIGKSSSSLISLENDSTFLTRQTAIDNATFQKNIIYDIKGKIKWETPFYADYSSYYRYKKTDSFLYLTLINSPRTIVKIDYQTGKVIWQKQYNVLDMSKHIIPKSNGGEIILYSAVDSIGITKQYLSVLNSEGKEEWKYAFKKGINERSTDFIADNDNIIINTLELVGNQYQQVLRKITPCSYNFSDKVAFPDSGVTTLVANSSQRILCNNEKVSLTAPKYDGAMYEWRRDGQVFASGNSSTQEVNQSGTYQVAIKDTLCLYSDLSNALKFTIQKKASLAIDAPSTSVCEGEKITLAAKTTENSYFWQKDSQFIASTSPVLEPTSSGFYRLASYNEQCKDSTFSNTIAITIKPLPDATVEMEAKGNVFNKPSVKLTAKTGNGIGYQWYKDDVIIPNATRSYYESYVSGVYKVNLTQNGCTQTSKPLEINIFVPLANEKEEAETQIKVYPNPSNGQFSVTLPEYLIGANLELFDGLGKKIDSMVNHETINTSNSLPAGTYVLKITKNEKITSMKVIIE